MNKYEAHVTIEPVFDARLFEIREIASAHGFRVADLLMRRRKEDTAVRSANDTFMTAKGNDYTALRSQIAEVCKELKARGYKAWRYKIEAIMLDSRHDGDVLEVL